MLSVIYLPRARFSSHSQIITFDTVELWISCDWQLKSTMCHTGQLWSEAVWLMTKHISWRWKWNHILGEWKKWHNLVRNKNLTLNLSFPLASLGFSPLFLFLPSSFIFLMKINFLLKKFFPLENINMLWCYDMHFTFYISFD